MTAISKVWVDIADSAVDPDSPVDQALVEGMRDDLVHLREWVGASYVAGAVQDHNHDGVNSAQIAGGIGTIKPWPGLALPAANWDWCDGGTLLRASYPDLKNVLMKEATVTVTIASPAVVTWPGHGLRTNMPIKFFTTGALPTGITAGTHGAGVGTVYYVKVIDSNTFNIATTPGGANINTSGTQSGTHTGTVAPHGDGDGSTTFHKPDLRGRTPFGRDDMGGSAASRVTNAASGINGNVLGDNGGAQTVTLATANLSSHSHVQQVNTGTGTDAAANRTGGSGTGPITNAAGGAAGNGQTSTQTSGSGTAHQNMPPSIIEDWIIQIA